MYNILKRKIGFEWDENKNQSNIDKHGISFEEAQTAFYDLCSLIFDDENHSNDEERYFLIGESRSGNLLIVSHCYRGNSEDIRIISARHATKHEAASYLRRL